MLLNQLLYLYRYAQKVHELKHWPALYNPYAALAVVSALILVRCSWSTTFTLLWIGGFVVMFGSQYFGSQGATLVLFSLVTILWVQTAFLWFVSISTSSASFLHLGDYGALTDNYLLQLQFVLDSYSLSYILLTNTIGLWALLFATNYMRAEPRILNFLLLLYFFLISMVLLLAAGNFPTLMLGWELIGCFSFLLINFWTTRVSTAKSAFKAFFFNKLSDAALVLSLIVLVVFLPNTFSLSFSNLYLLQGVTYSFLGVAVSALDLFLIGIVVCSFCKSAQLGFHAWLPDSMEAPVPASALIHSATLVSAGIFLLGRHEVLTSLAWVSPLLLIWCSLTSLYGGVVAAYQTDLKKVLAYSTISHCGFLFMLVAYNNFFGLVLYLHLHGWFKSYSFMAAGNIITKYLGYQDYRRMGGGAYRTTLESLVLTVSIGCLGGLPFLLGFFNKHYLLMLEAEGSLVFSNVMVLAAAFTGLLYAVRTISSLVSSHLKTPYFNIALLQSGISKRIFVSAEPLSNIVLLAVYPIAILVFTLSVLCCTYWESSLVYHSTFSILFFYLYFILLGVHLRSRLLTPVVVLLTVKLLYVPLYI